MNPAPSHTGQLCGPRRQSGAVLIVSLILLVVMTLLALTGMNTTSLEEKMASNSQETSRAFQVAELAVSRGFTAPGVFDALGDSSDPDDDADGVPDLQEVTDSDGTVDGNGPHSRFTTSFLGTGKPPVGTLDDLEAIQTAFWNVQGDGQTRPDQFSVSRTVHLGVTRRMKSGS